MSGQLKNVMRIMAEWEREHAAGICGVSPSVIQDARAALIRLGTSTKDADARIQEVLKPGCKFDDPVKLIEACYKRR